jgi:hypothetical protein
VLLAFGTLMNGLPVSDVIGMAVGHLYWYLEDIYPRMMDTQGRPRGKVLKTPRFMYVSSNLNAYHILWDSVGTYYLTVIVCIYAM